VPELRLVVVSDRLLERDRRLRRPADLVDLLDGHLELDSDLRGRRLTPELGTQLPLRPEDLVQLLDDVDRHPDRPALVGERPRDRLPDPPRGVRRELEPFPVVELLGGPHEPDRALLDQVEKRQSLVAVALRDRDDETQVRLHHRLLRAVVAPLDPLRELDLLSGGQEIDLADGLEEELERIRRDLELERVVLLGDGRSVRVELLRIVFGNVENVDLDLVEEGSSLVVCHALSPRLAGPLTPGASADAELLQAGRTDE